jgi:predicted lipoprotein with Yx(FWY)xxD motif
MTSIPTAMIAAGTSYLDLPEVPRSVQIISEGGAFVMRTLVGAKPLYTFDGDEPGKSNCTGSCSEAWPALLAPEGAAPIGKWSVIVRADGASQWAYDGKPVYSFARDENSVATGDGIGGVWHLLPVLKPD